MRTGMASAIVFCPRPELSGSENLRGFIQSARVDLQVFGTDLNFDNNVWDVTDYLDLKGRGNKRVRINFFAFSAKDTAQVPLPEPFLLFAKAYFRYMHGLRPKKFAQGRLYALKALAKALEEELGVSNVERVNGHVFDTAARILQRRYVEALAYRLGGDLEQMAAFLTDSGFTAVPVRWRNTVPRPSDTQRVGREFDQRRVAKMPSDAALEALTQAFRLAKDTVDVLITSITAILLAAPSRISEVLLLPVNCEITQKTSIESRVLMRWWPSKGGPPMVKPVYSGMSDVVSRAITNLKTISEPARKIAAWYESNPNRLYLPTGTEHLRSHAYLTLEEIGQVIGFEYTSAWCSNRQIRLKKIDGRSVASFEDVEQEVLSLLPQGFPVLNKETNLRYSEALLIVRKSELRRSWPVYLCMIEPVPIDAINLALGANECESVFDRFGFTEADGSRIKVTTHQFRHYLNTIAQSGGLSQLDIAKWSGRVDVRQNAAYDHVSSAEMLVKIREAVGDSSQMFGPLGHAPDRRLISRDEFAQLKIPTAHTTELGFCVHDFTMAPCEIHRDCINCEELVCIKGDSVKNAEVKRQLEEALGLLERAESADADGNYGADRWVVHQRATVERLEQLCAILDDPAVPRGAFITLARGNPAETPRLGRQAALGKAPQLKLIGGEAR